MVPVGRAAEDETRNIMVTPLVFYLTPAIIIVAGIYVFVRFIPDYAAPLSISWGLVD